MLAFQDDEKFNSICTAAFQESINSFSCFKFRFLSYHCPENNVYTIKAAKNTAVVNIASVRLRDTGDAYGLSLFFQ